MTNTQNCAHWARLTLRLLEQPVKQMYHILAEVTRLAHILLLRISLMDKDVYPTLGGLEGRQLHAHLPDQDPFHTGCEPTRLLTKLHHSAVFAWLPEYFRCFPAIWAEGLVLCKCECVCLCVHVCAKGNKIPILCRPSLSPTLRTLNLTQSHSQDTQPHSAQLSGHSTSLSPTLRTLNPTQPHSQDTQAHFQAMGCSNKNETKQNS